MRQETEMAPRGPAHNPKPDSFNANLEAARLLTSLFTKGIISKGDKARKWHKHPTYSSQFSSIAMEKFRKRYTQLYTEKFGVMNERKYYLISFDMEQKILTSVPTEVNLCQPKSTLSVQSDSDDENANLESSLNGSKSLKGDYTEKKSSLFFLFAAYYQAYVFDGTMAASKN